MFCAISGEAPQEPVVSRKSGFLYEKRLILKYLADNGGKEPGTGEDLAEDDLIPIKLSSKIVKPRPPTVNSVPTLLALLQNEWDSVVLETYQLKQQHNQLRQELSNALYENDAAKRVIARLKRERDQARDSLAAVSAAMATTAPQAIQEKPTGGEGTMDVDEAAPASETSSLTPAITSVLDSTAAELSQIRRKRKPGPEVATQDQIRGLHSVRNVDGLHGASNPGVLSVDLLRSRNDWALTGGKDGTLLVTSFAGSRERQVAHAKGHSGKKVTSVAWLQPSGIGAAAAAAAESDSQSYAFVSASADNTTKIWRFTAAAGDGEGEEPSVEIGRAAHVVKGHTADVTAVSVHPSGKYFVSASLDLTWAFADAEVGAQVARFHEKDVTKGYSSISFHPDGVLLGSGSADSVVRIWDVKNGSCVTSFAGSHAGKVTSVAFSENGYYLATAADGHGLVRLWDLRKLSNFHTIDLEKEHGAQAVSRLAWDLSGQYLGVATHKDIRIFLNKQWTELAQFSPHAADITDFKFGLNAHHVVSSGLDRKIAIFGV
ncbi:WD40-repeat-containing domain protein [Zopfochytrium polystomum]|nr:WD40-repeat-containing domain protein [Zopfochytrium polystomum]